MTLRAAAPLLLLCATASAQPVTFQLMNDVPVGKKPTLKVTAAVRVVQVKLELTRQSDGARSTGEKAALDRGKTALFSIGDGAAGRAHWSGTLSFVESGKGPASFDLDFDTVIHAPLDVKWSKEKLDLERHVLEVQLSRPAGRADLTVIGGDGTEIGKSSVTFHKEPPGTWLKIGWEQSPGDVMKLELHAFDADGNGAKVELVPWSVAIPHEEVTFATDSAAIAPSEQPKLDAAWARIAAAIAKARPHVRVRLYIAGHTDTVGGRDHNKQLSLERARAIAAYFKGKGVGVPIEYEGFGEDRLKVQTPDNTDEARNRRVDYVLGADQPPAPGAWKLLP